MRKFLFLYFLINSILLSHLNAQSLLATADNISALKNASFTEVVRFKFSFQEEFSTDSFTSYTKPVAQEPQIGGYYRINGKKSEYLFDGKQSISLSLGDSIYKISNDAITSQYTRSLLYWGKKIREYAQSPASIRKLKDTIIGNVAFNHYLVTLADSVQKGASVHDLVSIITDKQTKLPVSIVADFLGFADDGALLGAIEHHSFYAYRLNEKKFPDLSKAVVPSNFREPLTEKRPEPLPEGLVAPPLDLVDAAGKSFDLTSLRGKVVLLNFALLGCPHSINSAQILKRLHEKYDQADFRIISIYLSRNDAQPGIAAFDSKFNIRYPSYVCSTAADVTYHFRGFPHFVLLDKEGKILKDYNGFYAELEGELIKEIENNK